MLDSRVGAILADCRSESEAEGFRIKAKNAKALQIESMQNVSRSGERGTVKLRTLFAVDAEKTDARIEI